MLFRRQVLEGIARGHVTLAFRRWKRPQIRPGTRLRTALGEVRIGAISQIEETTLGEGEAKQAGFESLGSLMRDLRGGEDRALYRIELLGMDTDSRATLREDDALGGAEVAELASQLARWDQAGGTTGHHQRMLEVIGAQPAVPAAELADRLGVEKMKFKRDVRKLKELGLTESLAVGYRLSPRGAAFMRLLGEFGEEGGSSKDVS
jgi:hypothetical protein